MTEPRSTSEMDGDSPSVTDETWELIDTVQGHQKFVKVSPRVAKHGEILDRLHIRHLYPCKLTLQELNQVTVCQDEPNVAYHILKRILCADSKALAAEVSLLNKASSDDISPSSGDIDDLLNSSDESESKDQLNALDVFYAIYSCCDLLLKQALCEKLFTCKHAIPLVIPDVKGLHFTYGLWTLRLICIDHTDHDSVKVPANVATQPMHIVSFLHFGKCHLSKSKILNDLLTEQHDSFFHRGCITGDVSSILTEGLVELCLYLPSRKDSDRFKETIAFLNLRGNCLENKVPTDFMVSASHTVLALVPLDKLCEPDTKMKLYEMAGKLKVVIILVVPSASTSISIKQTLQQFVPLQESEKAIKDNIKLVLTQQRGKEKGSATLTSELLEHIHFSSAVSFEDLTSTATQLKMNCDEEIEVCRSAKKMAESIMKHFHGIKLEDCKEKLLPLQGRLWKEWSKLQQKQYSETCSMEKQDEIHSRMKQLRQDQAGMGITPMMQEFIEVMRNNDVDTKVLFLKWLQIYLGKKSREELPSLKTKWHTLKQRLEDRKRQQDVNNQNLTKLKDEVFAAKEAFSEGLLSIEHFFREVAQLYEVSKTPYISLNSGDINDFPAIMAQIMLMGSTFEIMDGDAANIPLTWIQAVINHLQELVGKDKHVLVLSVVGIQSSGKSTLLNAMFGLHLPVKSGQCTRGLFMQVLPIRSAQDRLPFDFLFVLDTEGLRSQEAHNKHNESYNHDNILTTMVIGIADITLINIKGENQSEMKDMLQIAVHAFLKMKLANSRINLQQKCVFIHQNVSAVDAGDNLAQGQSEIIDELNKVAAIAAENEGIADIDRFDEVIEFRAQKDYDLWYFSDCWLGDPPMAPSNPGYRDMVSKCRKTIMNEIAPNRHYFTVNEFLTHLTDIRKGSLSLDFVFSFRNSLEIKANNLLEKQFLDIISGIEKEIYIMMREQDISIRRCEDEENLPKCYQDSIDKLRDRCKDLFHNGKEALDEFFKTNELKTITAQWEASKQRSLQESRRDLERECEAKLLKIKQSTKLDLNQREQVMAHRREITRKAIKAGKELKDKQLPDEKLEEYFNDLWRELEQELDSTRPQDDEDIEAICNQMMSRYFTDQKHLIDTLNISTINYNNIMDILHHFNIDDNDITIHKRCKQSHGEETDDISSYKSQAVQITTSILQTLEFQIDGVKQRAGDIDKTDIGALLECMLSMIEKHNKDAQENFTLVSTYQVKLARHVISFAGQEFEKIHENYEKEYGIHEKVMKYKETAHNIFVNTAKMTKAELMIADFICDIIKPKIMDTLHQDLQMKLTTMVQTQLGSMKGQLLITMLDELANRKDFDSFMSYITSPSTYAETWIKEYFQKAMTVECETSDTSVYLTEAKIILDGMVLSIDKSVRTIELLTGGLRDWLRQFCVNTVKDIVITMHDFQEIIDSQDANTKVDNLKEYVIDILPRVTKAVMDTYSEHNINCVTWQDPVPYKKIFNKIWGCKAICPFCKEPCMMTDSRHSDEGGQPHVTIQHKPQGCGGWRPMMTGELSTETCNYQITTIRKFTCPGCKFGQCTLLAFLPVFHPYKNYKKYFPEWDIPPNPTIDCCKYWMWFVSTYQEELAKYYNANKPNVPRAWKDISETAARESLRQFYSHD